MRPSIKIRPATLILAGVCVGAVWFPGNQYLFSQTTDRAQVPTGQDLAAAEKEVADVFSSAIKQAKTPKEKTKVANELYEAIANSELPVKYVLLNSTIEMAKEAVAIPIAFEAIEKMGQLFEIDPMARKSDAISSFSKGNYSRKQGSRLIRMAFEAIEVNMAANQPDQASELAIAAQRIAKKTNLEISHKSAQQYVSLMRSMKSAAVACNAGLGTLESNPDDEAANLKVGRYFCFFLNDFEKGSPYLLKSNVEKLRVAAELEIKAGERLNLQCADAWWNVALDQNKEPLQIRIKQRAVAIYKHCLPQLDGIAKAKASSRIEELKAFGSIKLPTGIEIISAKFGAGNKWVDVTEKLKEILESDSTILHNSSKGLNVKDPAPGWKKKIKVTYVINGKQKNASVGGGGSKKIDLLKRLK